MSTTLEDLASTLDVTVETIVALVDQIAPDGDFYNEDNETLTDAGVEVITAQLASGTETTDDLEDTMTRLGANENERDGLLSDRDALIRQALGRGVSYQTLGVITGLSRSALDTIRRGERSRGNL